MKFIKTVLILLISFPLFSQETFPNNGVESTFSPIYAFTNAHLIMSSEKEIVNGTLLIQEDKILAADSLVILPEGSIIKDMKGSYIYPSFIDLYSNYGIKTPERGSYNYRPQYESNKEGAYHWNEAIHPEIHAFESFKYDKKQAEEYRGLGFGVVLSHSSDGIVRGTGTLVSLSDEKEQKSMMSAKSASYFSFNKGVSSQKYPSSLMGSIALLKQLF